MLSKIAKNEFLIIELLPFLDEEMFYTQEHKIIYQVIIDICSSSRKLNFNNIRNEIKQMQDNYGIGKITAKECLEIIDYIEVLNDDDYDTEDCIKELKEKQWQRIKVNHMNQVEKLLTDIKFRAK